ncbi:MerR family transcriptional regulator [Microbacterium sp. H1-D42]|uniref:MerR family DNA-binding transcriptional regulator n=1 Tax=Microbacterium sp. H1-D42 TaxID=2925844 RepID=UPI001F538705|nr:MerR family transcriptional regulator [Microbacterium sp. H1-D42]UNK71167.1 MerR family DNA-binding transcriptional regulator [Microbacterium sp. H1-D42]
MLGIGEFAGLTGLSVKALRHYDDKGVLTPSDVDDRSGYRRYTEAQVRAGVEVRALRDAGVALPEVAAALAVDDALGALSDHQERVRVRRSEEDRAFADAETALRALRVPVEVMERRVDAVPYVGRVITVPVDAADELTDDHANHLFEVLFAQVHEAGLGPAGTFWTTIRAGDRGQVELVCCWPTVRQADAGWGGPDTEVAVLPARTELIATWRPAAGEELPDGYTHPAVVALFEAVGARGIALSDSEVRQRVHGSSDQDWCVEVAITI